MKITSTSKLLHTVKENQTYQINYGALRKGSNTKVEIIFNGAEHLNTTKSCGCTTPTVEILENGFKMTVEYNNQKVGTINQYIEETVREGKGQKKIRINLKGQIV